MVKPWHLMVIKPLPVQPVLQQYKQQHLTANESTIMKLLKFHIKIILLLLFIATCYLFYVFVLNDYLDRSAISDHPSQLIKVWDDNALSIGGVNYDDSQKTRVQKETNANKWYLKDKRKLTATELNCLNYGFFSTVIINGDIDIICDNNDEIIYIK